jgi:hypothetical protein
MATYAQSQFDQSGGAQTSALTAFIDRWIYVLMAVFLITAVLVGFIPDSINKIAAVQAGERPPFPAAMHVHAVLMGSWMLLLLTQTTLMATGRRQGHMQLGVLGIILAPALVMAGFVLVPVNVQAFIEFFSGGSPEELAQLDERLRFVVDIALVQFRIGISFLLLVFLALRARKKDSGLHKRLMILATIAPIPAATDRMTFLYNSMPESPWTADLWPLFVLAPMFLWDLYRTKTIHRAYWIYAAVMVPGALVVNLLWGSDWWYSVAPGILYA